MNRQGSGGGAVVLTDELIHLPDKPAGVLTGILKPETPGESE